MVWPSITPETNFGQRYVHIHQGILWEFVPDERIVGFRLYRQAPGESAFRLHQVIELSGITYFYNTRGALPQDWDWGTLSQEGNLAEGYFIWGTVHKTSSGTVTIFFSEARFPLETGLANAWLVGPYRYYVVAFDAEGREGNRGGIVSATILGEIPWVRPTEGQVLERVPSFQWVNIVPADPKPAWSSTNVSVSEAGNNWRCLWGIGYGGTTTTSAEYCYGYTPESDPYDFYSRGYCTALEPGHHYYATVTENGAREWGNDVFFGYSRIVGFTVE